MEQDAQSFMRRIDARRDEANARMFRTTVTGATESTVIVPMRKVEQTKQPTEETKFSPNSNAQGT